ncbi:MAG: ribose import ATP-binding protein RbsA [Clostridia bacterium]|jgi:ABC-type sugar transport system ATPase subunit|nr:ribose import ATP-binding protein RbsA [Clostridia bacterium]
MSCVLELKDVVKEFPGVKALDNMQLQLEKGELHAVCGENGAGKSTLMKVITGVYKPDQGEMILKGEPVKIKNPNDAYSKGIAIIYQETSLFPELTVLENIFIGHEPIKCIAGIKVIDYAEMRKKAIQIFNKLGIDIDLDGLVSKLGVATKQMIEIAKALSYEAEILILDEPTAALTNREVRALFETIARLKSDGVSMVYISHRLEEIFEIADRVTVVRDGQYVATAHTKEVTSNQLISWMVGRSVDELYPKVQVDLGDNVLEVKKLNQYHVLRDINLHLRKGEILGIAGLGGSGRTELAFAICGFSQKDTGEIIIDGKPVCINSYRDAMRNGLVYVSEDRKDKGLVVAMSVKENLTMPILSRLSNLFGIKFKEEESMCQGYIDSLSIKTPHSDFTINNLSGGNQQKVSVAKALAVEPKILILDEPTRGVDVGAKAEIHRMISTLASKGLSIIMISSDLPEILGMADRVYVMKEGKIAGEFMGDQVTQEKVLTVAL